MPLYDDTMRSIIDLPPEQIEALAKICRREGISRAEAVRRAVADYIHVRKQPMAEQVFGLWRDRGIDGLAYERSLREEWDTDCEPSSIPTS